MRLKVDLANVAFLQKYSADLAKHSIEKSNRKEMVIQIIDEGLVDVVMFCRLQGIVLSFLA